MAKKKFISFVTIFILLTTLACSVDIGGEKKPQASSPDQQQPQSPAIVEQAPEPDIQYAGVSFSYDDLLAADIAVEDVPASEGDEGMIAPWENYPAHVVFHFNGYPLRDTFHAPRIIVYPIEEYRARDEHAASIIDELQQYLTYSTPALGQHIPFLPTFNAAQFITTKTQKMAFQNGEGVRFLTLYTQYGPPINNHELFYTFQGITADGRKYISAIFPVQHPNLPADGTLPDGMDFVEWAEEAAEYVANQAAMLDGQADDSFTPSLVLLDELIRSLLIE